MAWTATRASWPGSRPGSPTSTTSARRRSRTCSRPASRRARDESILDGARTVVICVPTPLSADGGPDLTAVRKAAQTVSRHLDPGTLVVLESTTYPGTTEEVVGPILEESGLTAGEDFHLAFSPERIDPGNPVYGVGNTPKIVGGLTPACAAAAAGLLRQVRRTGRAGQGHARGRDGQAAGEHLPARQHRAGQRDGGVLPRARHRPVGRDRVRRHQAVRLPGVLPGPRRRRSLHPDRPELPVVQGALARATRSGSSSWRRRSTTGCRATWSSARRRCSTARAGR